MLRWKHVFFVGLTVFAIKWAQKKAIDDPIAQLQHVLDTVGIYNSRVVICQWIHETGIMKSKVYKENHNPFGMKEARRHIYDPKPYSPIGTKNGHAEYFHVDHFGDCTIDCYMDAIYDYRDWQKARGWYGGDDMDYMNFLVKKNYAEDQKYIDRLKKYYSLIY